MLTEQEEILLDNRDEDFMSTFGNFDSDVYLREMQQSESLSKYTLSYCHRKSFVFYKSTAQNYNN